MKGCFLILNYKDSNITQEAVRYLKVLDDINDCNIIIFDNGSDNGSLEQLRNVYKDDDKVIVGGSKKNLGFSEGNNAAYKLAIKYCDQYDFAVAMNSDVMIHQKDFINRIRKYVEEGEYAVIGPDVYNSHRKTHDSPLCLEIPSVKDIDKLIDEYEHQLKNADDISRMKRADIKAKLVKALPYWALQIYRRAHNGKSGNNYMSKHYGPVLNGCCLIYLGQYLEHETLLFEPDTFLYGEEALLSIKCKAKGYKIIYDPGIQIEHRESISTKVDKTYIEFVRQKNEKLIHAHKMIKKCIENNPWE